MSAYTLSALASSRAVRRVFYLFVAASVGALCFDALRVVATHSSEDTIARASYFSEPITTAAPLAACKKHKAKLIVAKLDRLTRNVAFLLKLIDAGVEVLFCDLPELNGTMGRFVLIVMANVAELEARLPVNPRPPGLLLG